MSFLEDLKEDEGFRSHAYQDSEGYWTIGYGTLIDKRRGGGITAKEAEYLLSNRVEKARKQLVSALDWVVTLDQVRFNVLLNMCFNMGIMGLLMFRKTLAYVKNGSYHLAATEMLDSRWAKQVGRRAIRLSNEMRSGIA